MPSINIVVDTTPIYIRYSPVTTPTIGVKFGAVDSVNDETGAVIINAVPNGGTTGQVLAKNSNTDNDTEWIDAGGGGGQVDTVQGTTNRISVDATDPANPIVDIDPDYDTAITNAIASAVSGKEDTSNKQTDLTPSATKFPTVDAVIAGLSTKPTVLFKRNTLITHTGGTSPTKVYSKLLPLGTFEANDHFNFSLRPVVTLNGNAKTINLKVNTTDSLSGAVTIATYNMTNTTVYFKRNFWFPNSLASIGAIGAGANIPSDETITMVSSTSTSVTFNFNQAVYFMIECVLAVGTDSILIHEFSAQRLRGSEL